MFVTIKGRLVYIDKSAKVPSEDLSKNERGCDAAPPTSEDVAKAIMKCADSAGVSLESWLLEHPEDYRAYLKCVLPH